jgi:hypothetical protein
MMSKLKKEFDAKECAKEEEVLKCPFVSVKRICSDLLTYFDLGQNSSFKIKENSIYECHQTTGHLTIVKSCSNEEKCNSETNECMTKSHDMVKATASIYGFNPQRHTAIKGNLFLVQEEGFIEITGKIRGLNFNSSNHSLNVHETGSVSAGSKCKDTGPPFNPDFMATTKASLLGSIRTNSRGEALVDLRIPAERVCLIAWTKYNILNLSLVVYSNEKLIGGESETRIACGLIEPKIGYEKYKEEKVPTERNDDQKKMNASKYFHSIIYFGCQLQ